MSDEYKFNPETEKRYVIQREKMVKEQIIRRGICDKKVLEALRKVPRHKFVPESQLKYAYSDAPLPIGNNQTISQPYIVALMTELLNVDETSKVLEIGTGSGYQTAILAEMSERVYSIEFVKELAEVADRLLEELGYQNVVVKHGNGYQGLPEQAPFDGIICTAAPKRIPQNLIDQLGIDGRLVVPVGDFYQELVLVTKTEEGIDTRDITGVRFVPMVGDNEHSCE